MDLSRRNFLAQSAVAAGAVAVVGQQTAGVVGASESASVSSPVASWWGAGPTASEPFVVYIRDAAKGEVSVLLGEEEVVYVDRALVARLQRTVRRIAW